MPGATLTKSRATHKPPLTGRESLFCRAVAAGETLIKAYELAGYSPDRPNASHLAKRPDIQAEITRLQNTASQLQQFTTDWWREKFLKTWDKAEKGDLESAVSLLNISAKVLGLYDNQQPIHPQAQALIAALAEGLARSRNTEAPKLPEAQKPPVVGAYQVLESKEVKSGDK